jgi:hypothetical protein
LGVGCAALLASSCTKAPAPPLLSIYGVGAHSVVWEADGSILVDGISPVGSAPKIYVVDDLRRANPQAHEAVVATPDPCVDMVVFRLATDAQRRGIDLIVQCRLQDRNNTSYLVEYADTSFRSSHNITEFKPPSFEPALGDPSTASRTKANEVFWAASSFQCGDLWKTTDGVTIPVDVTIGAGQGQWNNAEAARVDAETNLFDLKGKEICAGAGFMFATDVNRAGTTLAFVSSDAGVDAESEDFTLEVYDIATGSNRRVASGLPQAASLRWSPDGKRVLIGGVNGMQVIDLDGNVTRLAEGRDCVGDWSPDGKDIAQACTQSSKGTTQLNVVPAPE